MKRIIKAVFCTAVTVFVFLAVQYSFDWYEERINVPEVFETGNYTDYYYSRLTETEKQAYTAVKQQVYAFPENIKVPALDSDSLENVLEALICDNPYMFMFDSCSLITAGSANYFEPDYLMTAEEYETLRQLSEQKADSIIAAMPETNNYEKQLYLHDAVIDMCIYSDTGSHDEADISGAFINGSVKCSGYAKAYKLLLDKTGIPCVLVNGYAEDYDGNGSYHMWVATETDGVWSYTDITWDDPITDTKENICRRVYFCMSEDMLSRTHSQFDFIHDCPDTGLYFYKASGNYYNDYNIKTLSGISRLIVAAAADSDTQVDFMFSDSALLKEAETSLFTNEEIYTALTDAAAHAPAILTDRISYRIDYDINLITLFFELED